jgi:hypothetical protein
VGHPSPRGHLLALDRSFRRTLQAENKSPRTVEAHTDAVRLLAAYCTRRTASRCSLVSYGASTSREFIADQLARWKPATAHNRYRSLHAFSSGQWPRATSTPAPWMA